MRGRERILSNFLTPFLSLSLSFSFSLSERAFKSRFERKAFDFFLSVRRSHYKESKL